MCRIVCIVLGALAGALAWYLLQSVMSGFPLLLLSAMVFVATAWMLHETFCGEEVSSSAKAVAGTAAVATGAVASANMGKSDRDAWAAGDSANAGSSADAGTPVASLVSDTGSSKSESVVEAEKVPVKKKPAAKKAAAKSTASKSKASAAKPAAAKKAPAKKPAAKKAGPERLKKARGGKADDLKLISGVGPKLEKTLNGLGFYHFDQIAKWKKADVAIVDDELSFKGRIERDDWIKQSKALAKGGEAEYIKVFGKKPR